MTTNDKYLEQIIKSAEKTIKFGKGDTETALFHARKTAEAIGKDIYERELNSSPKGMWFGRMVDEISQNSTALPKKVYYSLKAVQNFGGTNAHADEDVDECLEPVLELFSIVVKWYFQEYRNMPLPTKLRFQEGQNIEPVNSSENLVITPRVSQMAYCLFGYETDGKRDSELWKNPNRFNELLSQKGNEFYQKFEQWLESKRNFSVEELFNGYWIKVADHGHQHRLKFHEDNTLQECSLFSFYDEDCWDGTWKLENGVLSMSIAGYEEIEGESQRMQIGYELTVFASLDGIHSAVENYKGERNAYFKVLRVR